MVQIPPPDDSIWCLKLAACVKTDIVERVKSNTHEFDLNVRTIRDVCGSNDKTVNGCLTSVANHLTKNNYPSKVHQNLRGNLVLLVDPPVEEDNKGVSNSMLGSFLLALGVVGSIALGAYVVHKTIAGRTYTAAEAVTPPTSSFVPIF